MHSNVVASILFALGMLIFASSASKSANGRRILGLFPVPIRSHYAFYEKLLVELALRGHEVDVITHFPRGDTLKNYNELSISGSSPSLENNISIADHSWKTLVHYALEFRSIGNDACAAVLQHPIIDELKTPTKHYDLIITEMFATDCLLPLAHIYKTPIVGVSSSGIMPWADERMGNPDNPAYISNYFLPLRGKLNFIEKVFSTATNIGSKACYHLFVTMSTEIRGREVFGDIPPIENIAKNTVILLANRHFSLDEPRPLVPGVIEVGGMHIEAVKPIQPKKLEDFINSSKDGVIYFSMGTLINMRTFSQETLHTILQTFAQLKQNIVMKLPKDTLTSSINDDNNAHNLEIETPSNVYIADHLPQVDILCNAKTRLFITHGGHLSMQEAAYCGTPIIGIPFYPHQEVNVKNYVNKMAGIHLDYSYLNAENFQQAIDAIISNSTFKENAMRLSEIFKDRPLHPLDSAVYWTEYALHHGGEHLRSLSADLIIFEYLLVDIVIIGVLLAFIGMYIMYMVLQFLQELFDRPPPAKIVDRDDDCAKKEKRVKDD